jgi:autotransporter passenger strand-loop-strand repeat protein
MTTFVVSSGEVVSGRSFGGGVTVTVQAGGTLDASSVKGSSSIWNYGQVSGLVVGSGAYLEILSGSTAVDTVVRSGGQVFEQFDSSQSCGAQGTVVKSGGAIWFANVTVSSGVFDFGGAKVDPGATVVLYGDEVLSGGTLATKSNMFLQGGMTVSSGGTLEGAATFLLFNYDYGLVSGCAVGAASGTGSAYDNTNALLTIMSGGAASGVKVRNGAMRVAAGADAVATHLTSEGTVGGKLFVLGSASATVVGQHATEFVGAGGIETAAHVTSGGFALVGTDGQMSGATVSQAILRIESGGSASQTRVHEGVETILRGGFAAGTVLSGGREYDIGVASGTVIRSGGREFVSSGAVASGSLVGNGGNEIVLAGGTAAGATVLQGGRLGLHSGAVVAGAIEIQGGQVVVGGPVVAGPTFDFAGSRGTLQLGDAAGFGAAISGFGGAGEKIDLGGFAFTSGETAAWAQTGASGTLTVSDGAKVATLTLIGSYATGDFILARDGHGGTLVTAPLVTPTARPVDNAAARLVEAAARLPGGRGGAAAPLHAVAASPPPLATAAVSGR